jgi:hypothetical protein
MPAEEKYAMLGELGSINWPVSGQDLSKGPCSSRSLGPMTPDNTLTWAIGQEFQASLPLTYGPCIVIPTVLHHVMTLLCAYLKPLIGVWSDRCLPHAEGIGQERSLLANLNCAWLRGESRSTVRHTEWWKSSLVCSLAIVATHILDPYTTRTERILRVGSSAPGFCQGLGIHGCVFPERRIPSKVMG